MTANARIKHLCRALEQATNEDTRYHLRQALQYEAIRHGDLPRSISDD